MTTVTNDAHGATRHHQPSGTDRPAAPRAPGRRAAGRRFSAVLAGLLLFALAFGVPPAPTVAAADYILMPRAELLALPTSGAAWTELKSVADEGLGTPDLCDQESKHHLRTLASALVHARTGSAAYGTKARQGVMAAIGTQRVGCDNATLALGRQLTAYVLAADFADLSGANDTAFRAWLGPIRTKQIGGHSVWTSLTITHTASAANWGAHAGASRIAAGLYLGDSTDVAAAAKVTRGFLGDRSAYAGFTHKLDGDDLSWTCSGSQSTYTPENPPCTKSGINVDGGFVTDISRGGPLHWPPLDPGIPYQLETIQGMGIQVELLYRHGYGDAWSWSSKALKRAAAIITRSGDAGGTGWNETSASRQMPWLLNLRYDTDIPTRSAGMGRSIGFTDWLYGGGAGTPPPPPPPATGATYVPLAPARLLDTRVDNGLPDAFKTGVVRSFQVTGRGSIPADATAVTGNLTITRQTSAGYVSLGPTMSSKPSTSTLNAPRGDNRANGLTVKLSGSGSLSAVWKGSTGSTTHLVFDVTGYFTTSSKGATYVPLAPARLLDTRVDNGLPDAFKTGVVRSFQVTGRGGVPSSGVTAVTGNLTITRQTSAGYVSLGPTMSSKPSTSTLNAPRGDNRANGLTVKLSGSGSLSAVWKGSTGSTTHLVFDVTGYFTTSSKGATYVPLAPARLLDTRVDNGLPDAFKTGVVRSFQVTGRGGVPSSGVTAVTGNLTITRQTSAGYVSLGPTMSSKPSTSTLNAPRGDNRANGLTVKLSGSGSLSAVWKGSTGSTTHLVFDVTGYFR